MILIKILTIYILTIKFKASCDRSENVVEKLGDKPSFRIVAPKFICKNKQSVDIPAPTEVTVSMQTREGKQLKYRVQVFFELLGKLKGQQQTISIWRSVRQLQKKILSQSDEISLRNQIEIPNKDLVPGVSYTFQIIGYDEQERASDPQNFTLIYREGSLGSEIQQTGSAATDEVSIMLIGSDVLFADIPIIFEARSIWCDATNDYFMKWSMTNLRNPDAEKYLKTKGSILKMPSGIVRAGDFHNLSVEILGLDNRFITKTSVKITVLSKGYTAKISPEFSMVGISKDITIRLFLRDLDNTDETFKITWQCKQGTNEQCDNFNSKQSDMLEISFITKGAYEITAFVSLNGDMKTLKSKIEVNPDIIAFGNIPNVPTHAISTNSAFELDAFVEDLVPNCYAEWIVAEEKGFEYFDKSQIPGGLGNITVRDVAETFLSELVDYDNDTVAKNIQLFIPNKLDVPGWDGLKVNSKYKFRLKIVCPAPVSENDVGPRKNVTSYTDLIIETNAPPIGVPLEVEPDTGESLRTIFKFSTGAANDSVDDYPLRYSFNYIIDGYIVNIADFYESMVTTTYLPYSKTPIRTFYQICDSRDACSDEIYGPNITITLAENITETEFKFKQQYIQKSMENFELDNSFGTALSCIATYKNLQNEKYYNNLRETIIQTIKSTIKKLQNNEIKTYSDNDIIYFAKLSKRILDILEVDDKMIFRDLLNLLDNITPTKARYIALDNIERRIRREVAGFAKEKVNKNENTEDLIKISLQLLEKLGPTSNEETIERVEKHIRNYCTTYIQGLSSKFPFVYDNINLTSFEIIKFNDRKSVITTNFSIPFEKHPNSASFHFNKQLKSDTNSIYCIGKIYVPAQPNEMENIYDIIGYRSDKSTKALERLEFDEDPCALRNKENVWDFKSCCRTAITKTLIQCNCKNFGTFKASVVNISFAEVNNLILTTKNPLATTINTGSTSPTVPSTTSSNEIITTTMITLNSIGSTTAVPIMITSPMSISSSTNINDLTTSMITSLMSVSTSTNNNELTTSMITSPMSVSSSTNNNEVTTSIITSPMSVSSSTNNNELTTSMITSPMSVSSSTNNNELTTFTVTLPMSVSSSININELTTSSATASTESLINNIQFTTSITSTNNLTTIIDKPFENITQEQTSVVPPALTTVQTTSASQASSATTAVVTKPFDPETSTPSILTESPVQKSSIGNIVKDTEKSVSTTPVASVSSASTIKSSDMNVIPTAANSSTTTLSTNENLKIQNNSSIISKSSNDDTNYSYSTAFGILTGCAIFGILIGIIYNRRKRQTNVIQEMEISAAVLRQQSPGIRYARFHDEVNMGGNFEDDPIS